MDYKAKREIDVQEAFDELRRKEQEEFIKSNLSVLDTDDLIEVIESRGYKVIDEEYEEIDYFNSVSTYDMLLC